MGNHRNSLEVECKQLMGKFRSLILATSGEDGAPEASTVPYFLQGGGFVIFVGELARHTSHLLGTGRWTVLFLEEERESANIWTESSAVGGEDRVG